MTRDPPSLEGEPLYMRGADRVLLQGFLALRPTVGDNSAWSEHYFVLTVQGILHQKSSQSDPYSTSWPLSAVCTVSPGQEPSRFQIITPTAVLQLRAESALNATSWITTLHEIFAQPSNRALDPLLLSAVRTPFVGFASDSEGADTYDARFEAGEPLDIVLERAAEWAIVRQLVGPRHSTASSVASRRWPLLEPQPTDDDHDIRDVSVRS